MEKRNLNKTEMGFQNDCVSHFSTHHGVHLQILSI